MIHKQKSEYRKSKKIANVSGKINGSDVSQLIFRNEFQWSEITILPLYCLAHG